MKKYNILISFDDNYYEQAKCLLYSLKKHNRVVFDIYLFYEKLSDTNLMAFEHFIKNNKIGRLIKYYFKSEDITLPMSIDYISKETYFRLFAPFFMREKIERILYLDCDMVCTGSITELYDTSFDGNIFVGCRNMVKESYRKYNLKSEIEDEHYINAGVLLFNLNEYKKFTTPEEIGKYIEKNINNLPFQDQDVINRMFKNKIKIIDNKYNYQITETDPGDTVYEGHSIVHYSTRNKPWQKNFLDERSQEMFLSVYYEIKEKERNEETLDIIIPVYNSRKTLPKTLASIYTQDIIDRVKVYVIDDCSTEDYKDIIKYYKDKMNIHYHKLKKNSGPGVARNEGLKISKGKFISFIDGDDLLYDSTSLKTLLNAALEVDVVRSVILEEEAIGYTIFRNDNISLHGKIYRRSFLEDNDIKFSESRSNEDIGFNAAIDLLGATFNDIPETTYLWCNNYESITRNDKKNYHDVDLINFAYNIYLAVADSYSKFNNKVIFSLKAILYMKDIYYRSYDSHKIETFLEMREYNKKIYEIIRENNVVNDYKVLLIKDEKFYNFLRELEDDI